MGECCSNQEKGCCHPTQPAEKCSSQSEGFGEYFLKVADEAWEEVLKDQIKEYILSTQKERMAGLAKIVAEANNQRWRHKMEKKRGCSAFREDLERFFKEAKK